MRQQHGLLPEGPEAVPKTMFMNDEAQLTLATIDEVKECVAEYKKLAAKDKEVHAQLTAPYLAAKNKEVQPEALVDTVLSRRQRQREKVKQEKAAKKKPESAIVGNKAGNIDDTVAYVDFGSGRKMQGFLQKGEGSAVWFVTGRHLNTATTTVDGWANFTPPEGTLFRPGRAVQIVRVGTIRADGTDRIHIQLVGDIPTAKVKFAKPETNGVIHAKWYDAETGVWQTVVGKVIEIFPSGVFATAYSTAAGNCRMAVFNAMHQVVGGHYWPKVTCANGMQVPAADPEDGIIPKDFVHSYVPRCNPAGGKPQAPEVASETPAGLVKMHYRGQRLRTEERKVFGLRSDVDTSNIRSQYILAKPSTEMLVSELQKFGEPVDCVIDARLFKIAGMAAMLLEGDAVFPYIQPTLADFQAAAMEMDSERISAGQSLPGGSHHQYFLEQGGGDSELGAHAVALRVYTAYKHLAEGTEPDECSSDLLQIMQYWSVQGKKDGYKPKKFDVGRSIQAPTVELKLMWKVCFAENDQHWIGRDDMIRAGFNFDLPVPASRTLLYRNTLASLGLDESGFDRRMLPEFLHFFFMRYLPWIAPGVPAGLCQHLLLCTQDSFLVMTDGDVYQKKRGNPSGFPNTIRLNCVVQLVAWCYAAAIRMEQMGENANAEDIVTLFQDHIFLEICGDDSRANVLTDLGMDFLSASENFQPWLKIWADRLPWQVKIEGSVVFPVHKDGTFVQSFKQRMNQMPPLISRNLVVVDGILWTPLFNLGRALRRLQHQENRSLEEEAEIIGSAYATMALQIFWHDRGVITSPALQFLKSFGTTPAQEKLVREVVGRAYRHAALYCDRVDDDLAAGPYGGKQFTTIW